MTKKGKNKNAHPQIAPAVTETVKVTVEKVSSTQDTNNNGGDNEKNKPTSSKKIVESSMAVPSKGDGDKKVLPVPDMQKKGAKSAKGDDVDEKSKTIKGDSEKQVAPMPAMQKKWPKKDDSYDKREVKPIRKGDGSGDKQDIPIPAVQKKWPLPAKDGSVGSKEVIPTHTKKGVDSGDMTKSTKVEGIGDKQIIPIPPIEKKWSKSAKGDGGGGKDIITAKKEDTISDKQDFPIMQKKWPKSKESSVGDKEVTPISTKKGDDNSDIQIPTKGDGVSDKQIIPIPAIEKKWSKSAKGDSGGGKDIITAKKEDTISDKQDLPIMQKKWPKSKESSVGDKEVMPISTKKGDGNGDIQIPTKGDGVSDKHIIPIPAMQKYKANTGLRPPKRIGYGKNGRPIKLKANHIQLNISLNNIYHYDIDITPNKISKNINILIFEHLIKENKEFFKDNSAAYDRNKNFYTVKRLPLSDHDEWTVKSQFMLEDRKFEYKVKIKFATEVNLYQLKEFWEGRMTDMPQDPVQAIDVAMKHMANLRHIVVGRSLFSPPTRGGPDLGEGCELWMGRFQSVRPTQWKMTLNVDLAATAFYIPLSMIDFINDFFKSRQNLTSLNNFQRIQLQKELKNLKVRVNHQGSIKRTYVIRDVTKVPATQLSFTMEKDGKKENITVANYFVKQYRQQLKFPNLPCLRVGSLEKQIYLPMEVCTLKEGQKKNNKLSDNMVANMIKYTAVPAPERQQKIMNMIKEANFNADPIMKAFGISVDDRLLEMDGRVIEPPSICYVGRTSNTATIKPQKGVWDMRSGEKFVKGATINNWALMCFEPQNRCGPPMLKTFFTELSNIAKEMGMTFNPSPIFNSYVREQREAESLFNHVIRQSQTNNTQLDLIVVILPGRSTLYGEIKRLGDVVFGVVTQCLQAKNVSRPKQSLYVNLCLKLNAKSDGINDIIQFPFKVTLFKEPVIVFGADVTHPTPGDNKMPSISAVVASMDAYPQKYTAVVKAQGHRVEIIENLCEMITILFKRFYKSTGAKPRKIIFYRDGVSEGQFLQVLQYEVSAIQKACSMLEKDYQPLITFAVVQKRHHTRLFCANQRDECGKSGNIPPGTIVDKGIVHPRENDFFLCSHAGIQGTSRPTHYHVLWDDNNFSADDFQSLTYALCHTYVRCNRAVSIPAPTYYAHHVAFRARHHIGDLMMSDTASSSTHASQSTPALNLEKFNLAITIQPTTSQKMYFA
ncbi:unnamed protein product [Gordionus sp. m RMFG-2023]|uniref:protein argonaute-2-like n=1 Tax=Gordionus sp. m RMFG-2023 TaxID=3053472 RepID=UPI0030E06DC0